MDVKKNIEIIDNNEALIEIRSVCNSVYPQLDKYKKPILARKQVVSKLKQAIHLLPGGLTFRISSAYRTPERQKYYWNKYLQLLKKEHPEKSETYLSKLVSQYVHPWKGKHASGHLTGAALDLRLCYKRNGYKLPMETKKLNFRENAKLYPANIPTYLTKNRELMYRVLNKVGFANYPREYWHWSYGDVYWAESRRKDIAFYGIIDSLEN
jgi:D-alanyl-D-alanine dipeptidase